VVHLFTGRYSETGREDSAALERDLLEQARRAGVRLIGPNCMGLYNPAAGIAFGYDFPRKPGGLGMLSQSGATASEVIYYASLRGIGFSKVVSYGNALDVDESELLDYLARDEGTRVIAAYVEGVRDGKRFLDHLRRATARKPVVVLKAGKGRVGARMAASHTAAMAGSDEVWSAVLRQAGAVEALTMEDLLDLLLSFYYLPPVTSRRVGIIGGGGGKSVLSAGEWEAAGWDVAPLPPEIESHIEKVMPEMWWGWIKNPIDLSIIPMESRTAGLSGDIIKLMAQSRSYDLVAVNMPVGGPLAPEHLAHLLQRNVDDLLAGREQGHNPLVAVLNLGSPGPRDYEHPRWRALSETVPRLNQAGLPVYPSPSQAASAVRRLTEYYLRQQARGNSAG
ncbi:MAG: hypothetical protein KKB20_23200, partial [Proteobacteria bacterium]|nr:hypothetical protein [Pseudomonadota bacterium]